MVLMERPPQLMELQGTPVWSKSPLSLSNSSGKGRLMLHLKKKPRARKEEREIRDPTTVLPLNMIICLTLVPSLQCPLVKPLVSMGWDIRNGDN
jgi:hypothetical protein